jgi:branched-chain amino acid transport system permease protein
MDFIVLQLLNSLSFSMLLFLVASGLSLIFGLMNVVNLAHGSFYLVGTYVALALIQETGNFAYGLAAACLVVPLIGIFIEKIFLRRLLQNELAQVLLTFGFIFILQDACLWIWGGLPQSLQTPRLLAFSVSVGGDLKFPIYRVFVIAAGLLVGVLLFLLIEKTKVGMRVRAGVDNSDMAQSVGVNVGRLFTTVFALGTLLATIAGVLGGPIIGVYPGADMEILLLALVVIIIGGQKSLRGAFLGSLVIGVLDNFGKALVPELSLFLVFAPMALVLAVRPQGLFGGK